MNGLYTVEEAKKKDCPAFRFCVNEEQVVQDGRSAVYYHANCRADECVVWRWNRPQAVPPGDARRVGYCGLGGEP